MSEIKDDLRAAYYEKTGELPEEDSAVGAALSAAASEILSLYVYCDYVMREAFPQTADREHLDAHAALRGITRKQASYAHGELTFLLAEPTDEEISVPAGTVCSVAGKPFVQFATAQDAVIIPGFTEVTVPAAALLAGDDGNAPEESVTVMVNPPRGVYAVTNREAFGGGCDNETDTALRRRILDAYSLPQTGYSEAAIREQLLDIPGIRDCAVQFSNGTYLIYVRTETAALPENLLLLIKKRLALFTVSGNTIEVYQASPQPITLTLVAETERTTAETEDAVRAAVREYCGSLRLGESFSLAKLGCIAAAADGIRFCEASSPQATDGVIFGAMDGYFTPEQVQVICHE